MIILLHGFGSNGNDSRTNNIIKEQFPDEVVLTPSYTYHDPDLAYRELKDFVTDALKSHPDEYDLVFIGISLGGFWARKLAETFAADKLILLNPSLAPHRTMTAHTGADHYSCELYQLSNNDIFNFKPYSVQVDEPELGITVFVADDDEVVPQDGIHSFIMEDRAHFIHTTGGHRFEGTLESHLREIEFAVYAMNGGLCDND